jgi:hypothetical protein
VRYLHKLSKNLNSDTAQALHTHCYTFHTGHTLPTDQTLESLEPRNGHLAPDTKQQKRSVWPFGSASTPPIACS